MTKPVTPADLADAAPADPAEDALAFATVPVQPRYCGWTAERQRLFIDALAETGSIAEACETAGVTARSAYRLRRRAGAESFNVAWDRAQALGVRRLRGLAFERAIRGTPRKIYHKGAVIAEEWVPSDRLLMYLLKHYDRSRFGNLSGLLPFNVPDPLIEAAEALPKAGEGFVDLPVPDNADMHESFDVLW